MSNLQKIVVLCIVGGIIFIGGFFLFNSYIYQEKQVDEERTEVLLDGSVNQQGAVQQGDLVTTNTLQNIEFLEIGKEYSHISRPFNIDDKLFFIASREQLTLLYMKKMEK
ncbi:MAG: hypothetical protein AABY40_02470 [Nanoarchaeota archaeon]